MNSLAPPLHFAYASMEQPRAAIDAHAQGEGCVVVVKRTKRVGNRKDGEVKALILACSQSTPPPSYTKTDLSSVSRPAVALAVMAKSQDIYNLRHAERKRILAGRSPLSLLLDGLAASRYFYRLDTQQQLTHLLIISP
ncbi:hypothetical protein PsorP6_016379 [Peronosclerospora sorghi]|uniref:Uncharacterized protein n=1 Tax=Peronosclerospora sorghi TaxID=230839 RepID=A0ACC0VL17_9STRA|nr:hypothetical protein PsorP6_016379 [Peronosclerospora sorghi]